MTSLARPHVLGIDDGPFEKRQRVPVPIVGVMMEGADLVEAVAVTEFPVDGAGATEFLIDWIRGLRLHPTLQGVVLGGITIAGLGVVDIEPLSASLEVPTLVVTRRDPANHRLREAFHAAGLAERLEVVERAACAFEALPGLFVAHAGIERDAAIRLLRAMLRKSRLPEPLRLAHLFAAALVHGQSRGRV
jgi:endonuclease V-like protein UPF0215 family